MSTPNAKPLPADYLDYPLRRYGMDHDRYDWSMLPERKPVAWPNQARVALWVVPVSAEHGGPALQAARSHADRLPRPAPLHLA
jgi:hypothetical protein